MEPFHFPRQPQPGDRGERRSAASATLAAQLCPSARGPRDLWLRQERHRFPLRGSPPRLGRLHLAQPRLQLPVPPRHAKMLI